MLHKIEREHYMFCIKKDKKWSLWGSNPGPRGPVP